MIKYFALLSLLLGVLCTLGCKRQQPAWDLPEYVQADGDRLVIAQDQVRMEILPAVAGRIVSFKWGQQELVLPHLQDKPKDTGTVLWSSPQSEWGWPPREVLDSQAYELDTRSGQLVLTSGIDSKTGYQFSKTYTPAGNNAIAATYRIYNRGTRAKQVAALEVTRLPPAGEVVFPVGDTAPLNGIFYPLDVSLERGLCWFKYQAKKIRDDHHKIMLDGREGWVAYRRGDYVLVKIFEDLPPEAIIEGEREIELFAHIDLTFIEIKQQGAAETLAPDEFLTWTVVWHGFKLPEALRDQHNPELLADAVRQQLRQAQLIASH